MLYAPQTIKAARSPASSVRSVALPPLATRAAKAGSGTGTTAGNAAGFPSASASGIDPTPLASVFTLKVAVCARRARAGAKYFYLL